MKQAIERLSKGKDLTTEMMHDVMRKIMRGNADDAAIAGFLVALTMKGETIDEVTAAVEVVRELSDKVVINCPGIFVDPVGTGGDGSSLFNVSTASSIMASAAGVAIAKHGNIAASSASGSADVLREAGVNLNLPADKISLAIEQCHFAFMFAQSYHSAMRYAVPARKAIGIRTLFNVIGPLANPAGVKHQVLGVFSEDWLRPMVEVAKRLGSSQIIAIHADNGLDELSVTHENSVCQLYKDGRIKDYRLDPKEFFKAHNSHEALKVANARESLQLITAIFKGEGPRIGQDMLALNTAAILLVAEKVSDWREGIDLANEMIDSGAALKQLSRIVAVSRDLESQQ